jgi:transcriptional regulator with XRE-family HTH domain
VQIQKQKSLSRDFGNRLRHERKRQGITIANLSELSHIEQSKIIEIEYGEKNPDLQTLVSLLLSLGVSADFLVFGIPSDSGEKEALINKFMKFISTESHAEIAILFELVKIEVKYKYSNNSCSV